MPRGKKKFALIWWVDSGETDVVSLSMIPKKHQQVNSVFTLKWRNYQTRVDTNANAKLLVISEDENELHRTIITDTGTLHDTSQKIFSKEVQAEQKTINNNKKLKNDIKRSSKLKVEEKIAQDPPIFPTGDGGASQSVQQNDINMSPTLHHSKQLQPCPSYESNVSNWSHNNAAFAPTPYSSTCTSSPMSNLSLNLFAQISPLKPVPPQHSGTISPGSTSLLELSKQNFPSAPSCSSHSNEIVNSLQRSNDLIQPTYSSTCKPPTSYSESLSAVVPQCCNSSIHSEKKDLPQRPVYLSHSNQSDDFSHQNHFTSQLSSPSYVTEAEAFEGPISHRISPIGPACTRKVSNLPQEGVNTAVVPMSHSSLTVLTPSNESFRSPPREIQQAAEKQPASAPPNSINESNAEISTENTINSDLGIIFYGIELGAVTKQDILRQEQLLQAMKRAYESQQKAKIESAEKFPLPDCYFEPGDKKIEISPNCGIFLSISRHKYIHDKAVLNSDWKIIVRETLLDIYGQSIANYSATGRRTNRPGIDYRLFQGLHEWIINTPALGPVSKAELIDFINKIASNKRKYRTDLSKERFEKK